MFELSNLPKNKEWYDVKKDFFSYGYVSKFFYKKDGTAILEFSNLTDEKHKLLIEYLKKHNIDYKKSIIPNTKKHNTQDENRKKSQVHTPQKESNNLSIQNPSFHYYKSGKYGKEIEKFQFSDQYKRLFEIEGVSENEKFELTTTYPGLFVGSGYNHPKLKENKDDFQLGFFFDHTTGLPMIPGSSIKGIIRSLFSEEKFGYLQDVYAITEDKSTLEKRLFIDGSTIFYDAYIVNTSTYNKGKIFGSDYITSHYSDESLGQFKEPNPIKFLKVLPDVTFAFQFKGRHEDVSLIKSIILDFGLGAKTNVGYGQFKAALTNDEINSLQKAEEQKGLEIPPHRLF